MLGSLEEAAYSGNDSRAFELPAERLAYNEKNQMGSGDDDDQGVQSNSANDQFAGDLADHSASDTLLTHFVTAVNFLSWINDGSSDRRSSLLRPPLPLAECSRRDRPSVPDYRAHPQRLRMR